MSFLRQLFAGRAFGRLDQSIDKLKLIRDSYRAMNLEIYGEELAKALNEW